MADPSEFAVPAALRKVLERKVKERGGNPATALKMLGIVLQEGRARQKTQIRELLEEESVED